jgi:hypothetical protein
MWLTRDRTGDRIELWENIDDFHRACGSYFSDNFGSPIIIMSKRDFKLLFPNQKLPRKGSCKYVELRLYIPGEK